MIQQVAGRSHPESRKPDPTEESEALKTGRGQDGAGDRMTWAPDGSVGHRI